MKQIFNIDGEVYSFLQKMYRLMLLNLLILAFSLPIVTIPCALITGYQILKEYNQLELTPKRYFLLFRKNMMVSFKLLCTFFFILFLLSSLLSFTRGTIFQFLVLLLIAFFIVFLSNTFLIDSDQVTFQSLLRYGLGISLKYAGVSSIGLAMMISSFVIPVFLPRLGFIWVLFGLSVPMLFQVNIYHKLMKQVHLNGRKKE